MRIREVVVSAQLACLLEVAAQKPGNVGRYMDFRDTRFEHFLASAVAIEGPIRLAAVRGYRAGKGSIDLGAVGIGGLIEGAVDESRRWHRGKNTNLGIAMLLVPLSAACGFGIARRETGNEALRRHADALMKATTYEDTLGLYRAIRSLEPSWLGKVARLDVRNKGMDRRIMKERLNLYAVMAMTKGDSIARELTTGFEITFTLGYNTIMQGLEEGGEMGEATVRAFLEILSRYPDSLIARKKGLAAARRVSEEARGVLEGGLKPEELEAFDARLRDPDNSLNPGTTADLVASSLMVALLNGARP